MSQRINELIADQLERSFSANAWHGPALMEVLEDVTFEMAKPHPIDGIHSIWELVIHLTVWKDVVRRRLTSPTPILPTDAEDWPPLPEPTPQNWTTSLEKLRRAHQQLIETVRAVEPSKFESMVPGKDHNGFVMTFGAAQHDDYHGGQIALLKKAVRSVK